MHHIALFIIASLIINLIPGPDMLFIIAKTLSDHKCGGFLSTAGISTGLLVHTLAAATGLSLLLMHLKIAFELIKWLGAAYLIYLGIKSLFNKTKLDIPSEKRSRKAKLVFLQALVTNLLNPKIIIFFLAFLPQFVDPTYGQPFFQFIALGILFIITGTIVNCLAVFLADKIKHHVREAKLFKFIEEKVAGIILIVLGLGLALKE